MPSKSPMVETAHDAEASMLALWRHAITTIPPLLDFQAVEQRFGLTKTRQLELAATHEITFVKLGAKTLVSTASILRMLDRLPVAEMKAPTLVAMRQRSNARRAAKAARQAGLAIPATT